MTTATETITPTVTRAVRCSFCGRPTGEWREVAAVSPLPTGTCEPCETAGTEFGRDRNREYVRLPIPAPPATERTEEGEQDQEDHRARCENCGGARFRLWETQTVYYDAYTGNYDPDDDTVWFESGDYELYHSHVDGVECADCGRTYNGLWEWT